jgi:anti-sigma factor ChrR (cupin superfamily)
VKNNEQTGELAALKSLGALDGADVEKLAQLLASNADTRQEVAGFEKVVEAMAKALPVEAKPSSGLKDKILQAAKQSSARKAATAGLKNLLPPVGADGLAFLRSAGNSGWLPLPVRGAYVKLLSFDDTSSQAVVLGKLDAGASYPAHTHKYGEDIWMLSGDLHIGNEVINAGDFHHADAGSKHDVNWSKDGCVLLAVLSKEDLLDQILRK